MSFCIAEAACISLGLQPHQKAGIYSSLHVFCDTVTLPQFHKCNQRYQRGWHGTLWRRCTRCKKAFYQKKYMTLKCTEQQVDWYCWNAVEMQVQEIWNMRRKQSFPHCKWSNNAQYQKIMNILSCNVHQPTVLIVPNELFPDWIPPLYASFSFCIIASGFCRIGI